MAKRESKESSEARKRRLALRDKWSNRDSSSQPSTLKVGERGRLKSPLRKIGDLPPADSLTCFLCLGSMSLMDSTKVSILLSFLTSIVSSRAYVTPSRDILRVSYEGDVPKFKQGRCCGDCLSRLREKADPDSWSILGDEWGRNETLIHKFPSWDGPADGHFRKG